MGIRRVVLLTSAALLALAVTAGTASATVLDVNNQAYVDTMLASTSSSTLGNALIGITCHGTFEATIDSGDSGEVTDVTFQNCTPVAVVTVEGLPYGVGITETAFTITSAVAATINAPGVFHCDASATPNDIVADVDWDADTITMDELFHMAGTGCGEQANWTAVYGVTPNLHWG